MSPCTDCHGSNRPCEHFWPSFHLADRAPVQARTWREQHELAVNDVNFDGDDTTNELPRIHGVGHGLLHAGKSLTKPIKHTTLCDGQDRAGLADVCAVFCSDTHWGRAISTSLPKNLFAFYDAQCDETSYAITQLGPLLPEQGCTPIYDEPFFPWTHDAKQQPSRDVFQPVGVACSTFGILIVTGIRSHRVWRIVQKRVGVFLSLAGTGNVGEPVARAK